MKGRGGTVLQPAVNYLVSRPDFPPAAPVMILTDGYCEEEVRGMGLPPGELNTVATGRPCEAGATFLGGGASGGVR